MTYKLNKASMDLIKEFEGWRSEAYKDAVGVWTIGYGHTSMAGPPHVKRGMKISKAEGERMLLHDLQKYAKAVDEAVNVPLNDNQFGALVSFCYNVGPGNFRKSSVLKRVNAGLFSKVPTRLMLWNKAGGKVLRGLTRRRKAEADLFMKPSYASPEKVVDTETPIKHVEKKNKVTTKNKGKVAILIGVVIAIVVAIKEFLL